MPKVSTTHELFKGDTAAIITISAACPSCTDPTHHHFQLWHRTVSQKAATVLRALKYPPAAIKALALPNKPLVPSASRGVGSAVHLQVCSPA